MRGVEGNAMVLSDGSEGFSLFLNILLNTSECSFNLLFFDFKGNR